MKNLVLTILASSLISSSPLAYMNSNMPKLAPSTIVEALLKDGRLVDFKKEVEELHIFNNKIDYIELTTGEIIDRLDIEKIKHRNPHSGIEKATGVDGGG